MVLAVLGIAPAHAVHVSPSGSGQALVVPLYTVESGFDTLVSVTNTLETDGSAAAVKVHFVAPGGQLQQSFNLYLRRLSTWAFALSERAGRAASSPFEGGCLLEDDQGEVAPGAQFELAATHGYIELVEMGRLTDSVMLSALRDGECDALATAWPGAPLDPPAGGLRASASLINVPRSTMYSFNATALDNFRTAAMHTAPGDPLPDLSAADNHPDHTTSRNCNISPCVEDEWDEPVDAVSAALMALEVTGEYVVSDAIEGRTEWTVTFPTRRFYPEGHPIHGSGISLLFASRTGSAFPGGCIPNPTPFICETTIFVHLDDSIGSMRIQAESSSDDAHIRYGILSLPGTRGVESPPSASAGLIRAGFVALSTILRSNSGRRYEGRPAIGLVFQEFSNHQIQDSDQARIASYGNSFETSYNLERTK